MILDILRKLISALSTLQWALETLQCIAMGIIMFTMGIATGFAQIFIILSHFFQEIGEKRVKKRRKNRKVRLFFQILKGIMKKETKKRKELFSRAV